MTTPLTPVDALLVRGATYELLALGYAYPQARQRERIGDLSRQLEPWVAAVHPDWPDRLRQLRRTLEETPEEEQVAEWGRLFSGAVAAAPFESAYEPDIFRKQQAMADAAGFYRAFGLELPAASRWQPDHVGVELEFCAVVLQRAAHAMGQGWAERLETCIDALRKFLQDHLGRWTDAFAAALTQAATLPFYQHLAGMTRAWVELEVQAQGLAPARLTARQAYADDGQLPTCGACAGCGPDGPPAAGLPAGGCQLARP